MLFQLYWQYEDGNTEMRAQKDINSLDELYAFVEETQKDHQLPNGAVWMACDGKLLFIFAKEDND